MTIDQLTALSICAGLILVAWIARRETRLEMAGLSARIDRAEERNRHTVTKAEFELFRAELVEVSHRLAGLEASFNATNHLLQNIHNIMMSQHK